MTETPVRPSFNCDNARSATEKVLCSENELAAAELRMVAVYTAVLGTLASDDRRLSRANK